ncbi:hypothetical protein AB432_022905 [Brevibacillus brevis]|uniref:CbrC family protein n=1 Tax=Brevibacillus brevis TaxID=1393 RepID=A0A2Z4MMN0_BREBE|nr:CbrC family protein [Brevibacillus brevis]AWX57710.1 hypothetical protein AB432_022905 [Brevibacillus brevis]
MNNLPIFKYQPNVYNIGVFKKVPVQNCSICNKETDYIYMGPFYSIDEVENVCPWCIYEGTATKQHNGVLQAAVEYKDKLLSMTYDDESNEYMYFMGYDEVEQFEDDKLVELLFRTPGYISWQEPQWLSHCDEFCAFIGYVNKSELSAMKIDLRDEELLTIKKNYGIDTLDQVSEDSGIYLFQCINCGQHRIHIDHT